VNNKTITAGATMKNLFLVLLLVTTVAQADTFNPASSAAPRQSVGTTGATAPNVEVLKERMMKDDEIMALIGALQNDPEMQALLADPAIQRALQAGDINVLANNPAFLKLLNNPRIREIENKMQQNGTK
jgi:hypothetical protein